jgi:hypothetical protein
MKNLSHNLIEAARVVSDALDNIESTGNIAELCDAVKRALDRLNKLTDAAGDISGYLEALVHAAKRELDLGGAA